MAEKKGPRMSRRGIQRGVLFCFIWLVVMVLWTMGRVTEGKSFQADDCDPMEKQEEEQKKANQFNHAADATISLQNGYSMPLVGLGTAALQKGTLHTIDYALKAGYKLFDTAAEEAVWYQNEKQIGSYFANSPLRREQYFLTTKLHPNQLGFDATRQAITKSLENLQTSYIDLYLIHFPFCFGDICSQQPEGTWQDSWKAMEEAFRMGKIKALGVSNFHPPDLHKLLQISTITPDVVQGWFDPTHPEFETRQICEQNNIVFQAYSLLGTQQMARGSPINPVLTNEKIVQIAKSHNKSPANVVIRWALQLGIPVIPRSSNPLHIRDNINLDDYELTKEEMDEMNNIWREQRY